MEVPDDHGRDVVTDLHEVGRLLSLIVDRIYWAVDIIPLDVVPQPGMEGYDLAAGIPQQVVDMAAHLLMHMDGEGTYRIRAVAHTLMQVTQALADAGDEEVSAPE